METRDRVRALRNAAADGDPEAARELGRLLVLVPGHPEEPVDPETEFGEDWDEGPTWPAERWLRAAAAGLPEDTESKILLGATLLSRINHWRNAVQLGGLEDDEEEAVTAAIERCADEVRELYAAVLQTDPGNATAAAGLAVLEELMDDEGGPSDQPQEPGYSYYEVYLETGSGSVFYEEKMIAADPDELRWACDTWLELFHEDASFGPDMLLLYVRSGDTEIERISLGEHFDGTMDWSAITIPALPGEPLPVGHPVDWLNLYGYTSNVG